MKSFYSDEISSVNLFINLLNTKLIRKLKNEFIIINLFKNVTKLTKRTFILQLRFLMFYKVNFI